MAWFCAGTWPVFSPPLTGALSQKTAKLMVFKLVQAAAKTWRRLKGAIQLPKVVEGVTFTDGVATNNTENRAA